MRAAYEDTEDLLSMADDMFDPLTRDYEGQQAQHQHVRDDFESQVRLFEHHRGTLALHVNRPKESLSYLKAFKRKVEENERKRPNGQEQDQSLGVALNELGNAYLQNNNPVLAATCFQDSLENLKPLAGATINTISMPQISLGFALWLQDELDDAETIFSQADAERAEAHGVNDTVSFA